MKQKYSTDINKYHTLQSMIQHEIDEKVTKVKNSATDALMWLKRYISDCYCDDSINSV